MYVPIGLHKILQHHIVEDKDLLFLVVLNLLKEEYRLEYHTFRAISYKNKVYQTELIKYFTF